MKNTHNQILLKSLFLFRKPRCIPSPPNRECTCPAKRAVLHTLRAASLTAETALVLPVFFLAVITLISIMCLYGSAMNETLTLRNRAETAAVAADYANGEGMIRLNSTVSLGAYYEPEETGIIRAACAARVRIWNGRDRSGDDYAAGSSRSRYVYVTDYRSVYHTDPNCTHLELRIHTASGGQVQSMTNERGEHYHACEHCTSGHPNAVVYVTDMGDHYHNSPACSGLTRSVYMIPEEEAGTLHICSRCAARRQNRNAA